MKKIILTVTTCLLLTGLAHGQIARDFMFGGAMDLIKTDNDGFLEKAQLGLEGNYFITRQFTASAGLELWTDDDASFMLGARWYPVEEAFVRFRGLIGENDISIGGGWTRPINDKLRFEAIGDFYFSGEFAIRAGVMYVLRRK